MNLLSCNKFIYLLNFEQNYTYIHVCMCECDYEYMLKKVLLLAYEFEEIDHRHVQPVVERKLLQAKDRHR